MIISHTENIVLFSMRVHYIVINRLMQRLRHELIMNIRDVTGRVIMHPQMKIWFYVPSCPHVCYINMLSK
jgi:hypothetical protein